MKIIIENHIQTIVTSIIEKIIFDHAKLILFEDQPTDFYSSVLQPICSYLKPIWAEMVKKFSKYFIF